MDYVKDKHLYLFTLDIKIPYSYLVYKESYIILLLLKYRKLVPE